MPTKPPESPDETPRQEVPVPALAPTGEAPAVPPPPPTEDKPVVLATPPYREFTIPGDPGLHITPEGLALSERDAAAAKEAAKSFGIELVDVTDTAQQHADVAAALAHFQTAKER